MKKLVFTAAIAALGFTSVNAQEAMSTGGFNEGDVFISGAVGFGSSSQGDNSENTFTVSPKVGFFVNDNIAIGATVGYSSYTDEYQTVNPVTFEDVTAEDKFSVFSAGVFGRYYFTPGSQFSFFGELAAGITSTTEDDAFVEEDFKSNGVTAAFAPGISYFVSDNFAIEAAVGVLGYNTNKADVDGAEARNDFNIGADFSNISFGVVYKF
ncbi:outer membrane beta-barrel protein [Lacinutrix sp. Hel_I_90]|uniref:outer membrane beta-barrel protein n=1 Tax=Lacinutrix sp. Hel_I_90 TaxID=1249999 RepID=UPI0005CA3BDF|nr:outer membrane beta-barrel protein [Lacinutrix sp. Hel_I_90]